MESLNILHLSDFHFGNFKYDNPATLAIKIANTLSDDSKKVDVIIVSGDIYHGRSRNWKEDKEKAIGFFKVLIGKLKSKEICQRDFDEKSILFVPGNHDLIRDEDGKKQYEKYDAFIKEFYGRKTNRVIIDDYNFIYDFPEKKIAILGFNSCRIEMEREKDEDLKWINDIEFEGVDDNHDKIRASIKKYKEAQSTWDDFGYIDSEEMDNVFDRLIKEIPAYHDYTLIATFHHHFYPFPERQERNPDASFIRNYTEVLDQFQRFNIKLVLHGHKHTPVQRAITDKKYFDNPESIIYVLAAGSIGCKGVDNLSFHWLRVFDNSSTQLLEGTKYDFNDEEDGEQKSIILPPRKNERELSASELKVMLQNEDRKLFKAYQDLTDDFEQIIQDSDVEKIIKTIGKLYTVFPEIDKSLRKEPLKIYLILLTINYRVILLKNEYENSNNRLDELLERIEGEITTRIKNKPFSKNLINFLKAKNNPQIEETYPFIIKNITNKRKEYGAYVSATLFLADLFLNISRYGEYYFKEEKLDLKINIKLDKGEFYDKLPSDSIEVKSDIDRRVIYIDFKCKNPTVHKIAVLIVKDFEMRLNKFEESLKTINLKLYYISPKITPVNYDLENFHFNAYIPTLLPLLTGENLYDRKEVFIRELVQNSIDATLLRQKLQPNNPFNPDINIEFGEEERDGKPVKYFRITDSGIGMSKFTIERYFTSIGRSFYVSDEFKELKEDKNISYEAISNFGIGFLSSFMVSTEVHVKTKNIMDGESFEIEIPNYEGCFFIKKIEKTQIGTEITLYEDNRGNFDFDKFKHYMEGVFQGIPLNINITGQKEFQIETFKQQKNMLQAIKNNELIFYVPFSEETKSTFEVSWQELCNLEIDELEKFGISFNFNKIGLDTTVYNQGLAITKSLLPFKKEYHSIVSPKISINYPSSFIQLDVAREKINRIKNGIDLTNIPIVLANQMLSFIKNNSKTLSNSYLAQIDMIYYYLENLPVNVFKNIGSKEFLKERYALKVELKDTTAELSIVKVKEITKYFDKSNTYYFPSTTEFSSDSITFFNKINDLFFDSINSIKGKSKTIVSKELVETLDRVTREARHENTAGKMDPTRKVMVDKMLQIGKKEVIKMRKKVEKKGIKPEEMHGIDDIVDRTSISNPIENDYTMLFFSSSIRYFSSKRRLRIFWPVHPLLVLKSYIFSSVKVSEASLFKYVIDFEKFGKFLEKKHEEE